MNCISIAIFIMRLFEAVAIVLHGVFIIVISGDTLCDTEQYIEIAKTQTIKCTFNDDFANILWYNYSNVFDKKPLIALTKSGKSGIGLESGEYDVYQNGTLIINKVSELHETTFTAVAFMLSEAFPSTHNINVKVFALPVPPYPLINVQECSRDNQLCFLELGDDIHIQCCINGSRPVIQLSWYLETFGEDEEELQSSFTHSSTHGVHQSISTLENLELGSALLKILVCRANQHEFKLNRDESFLLAKKRIAVDKLNLKTESVWCERSRPATIICFEGDFLHVVWEKSNSLRDFNIVSFGSFIGEVFVSSSTNDYLLSNKSALTIPNVEINHEGTYICTSNNGSSDSLRVYNLKVYVRPDPPYPIVESCNHNNNCIVPAEREGNLTCTLRGIYPIVELEWQILFDDDKHLLSFINEYPQVTETTTSTADVTLTVQYKVNPSALNRLYLVCKPKGETLEDFSRTVELLLPEDLEENAFFNLSITVSRGILISGIILLTMVVIVGVSICVRKKVCIGCCRKQNETTEVEQGESQELLENPRYKGEKNKEGLFIKNLTIAYSKRYKAIQPIPFMAKLVYSLDEIYVDSGFVLAHTEEIESRKRFREKSCSYNEIYQTILQKQNFLLVKGEPGYGKSMFAMKIAHDWCKGKLTDTYDIVIFLSLKSLQNADSLYAAIKDNLMPNERNLTDKDIEKILRDSKSVLLLCDGLDEYPQRDSKLSIILNQVMSKHFKVALTVRSTRSLPNNVPPLSTILKLAGFNKDAQCEYVSKVHTIGKAENIDSLEFFNQYSPDVQDLFQVPLLFALFVHLQTNANLYNMSSSVTKLFNKVIECFHMHYRSKDDSESEQNYGTSHILLGKVAFQALKDNCLKFSKDELSKKIGNDLVEYYMNIGILVDEKQQHSDMGETSTDNNQEYNITFFHKLFCEWYAAYCLAEMFTDWNDVNIEKHLENSDSSLSSFDIYELHYLFRFACGLNAVAATNIIQWMETVDGCEKFTILCTLEQLGRTDSIMDHIEKLTSKEIQIVRHDTRLQKRSAIQLLQIASNAKKTISSLWLVDCLQPFKEDKCEVVLEDNIQVPVLKTLENLYIEQSESELNKQDMTNIIKYCCQCTKLKKVTFADCALPREFEKEALINFRKHEFEVLWYPSAMFYSLDRDTGGWKLKDGDCLLSEGQYQSEVDVFRDCYYQ